MNGKLRHMTAIYLTRGQEMLLLYRVGSRVVAPSWCGVGGHFESVELNDAKACVLREMHEEIGITAEALSGLTLRYITLRLKNGEVRQNYYFFAQLDPKVILPETCAEGRLAWMPFQQLPSLEMPLTAKHVLDHYLQEGQHTSLLYGGATTQSGTVFSPLTEFDP